MPKQFKSGDQEIEKIIKFLSKNPNRTVSEIAKGVSLSRQKIETRLMAIEKQKKHLLSQDGDLISVMKIGE